MSMLECWNWGTHSHRIGTCSSLPYIYSVPLSAETTTYAQNLHLWSQGPQSYRIVTRSPLTPLYIQLRLPRSRLTQPNSSHSSSNLTFDHLTLDHLTFDLHLSRPEPTLITLGLAPRSLPYIYSSGFQDHCLHNTASNHSSNNLYYPPQVSLFLCVLVSAMSSHSSLLSRT